MGQETIERRVSWASDKSVIRHHLEQFAKAEAQSRMLAREAGANLQATAAESAHDGRKLDDFGTRPEQRQYRCHFPPVFSDPRQAQVLNPCKLPLTCGAAEQEGADFVREAKPALRKGGLWPK